MRLPCLRPMALLATALLLGLSARGVAAQETVTIAIDGGAFARAMRAAILDPAERELGLKITVDSNSGNGIADLRAQVASGRPTVDIMSQGGYAAPLVEKQDLLEPLDFSQIDVSAMPKESYGRTWVAAYEYATVLTWGTEGLKGRKPEGWAALWDTANFPGRRTLRRRPLYNLEIAMVADGVPPADVYQALRAPGGIDRAFNKLATLRPSVAAWWTSGAQSMQLRKDAEAEMGSLWDGRARALKTGGEAVDFTYDQQILQFDCWTIIKGTQHKAAAMKLLAYMMRPEVQARFAIEQGGYPPSNPRAYDAGIITPAALSQMAGTPERRAKSIVMDVRWWSENIEAVEQRFTDFLQK
jgi:putative spermidine/putrescine transport system substrate-binding protein